ncbi:MAG: hypothetical protein IIC25_08075 [Chloroflexi bacterium]|nr:hypothetical protein [Chloroflexota bacterium]
MSYKLFALAGVLAMLMSVAAAMSPAPARAAEPETDAASAALDYIRSLQNDDGGFPSFGAESSPGATIDVIFAFVAAGIDPLDVTADGNSPVDYLATQAEAYVDDPGAAAKLSLALLLAGPYAINLGNFEGVDILTSLRVNFDLETGVFGLDTFDQALFLLASVQFLGGGGQQPPVRESAAYLRSLQLDDGGWGFFPDSDSDQNTTAIALQALIASQIPDEGAVVRALEYLHTAQNEDGGFGFLPGEDSDPNSTAFGIQALVAAGEDIDAGGPWAPDGDTPLDALLSFQNPETGAFQFFGDDSAFATYQGVPALLLVPFGALEAIPRSAPPGTSQTPVMPDVGGPGGPTESTPTPTMVAVSLPDTGAGADPGPGRTSWLLAAALASGAAVLAGAGVAARRRR